MTPPPPPTRHRPGAPSRAPLGARGLIVLSLLLALACAGPPDRVEGSATPLLPPVPSATPPAPADVALAPTLAAAFLPALSAGRAPDPAAAPTAPPANPPSAPSLVPASLPLAEPTAPPGVTPTLEPTSPPTPPPTPTEDLAALQAVHPNELGWVIVLAYHLIEAPEERWSRTPANFRADIEGLIAEGYYPINLIDLARGHMDVPAGKSPIVLTFDDSSSGQFRYLPDGTVDPDSAVGILLEAARRYPDDWRPRATFFVLLDVDVPDRVLFGQPEWAERKVQDLVAWGMEVGSHTISHWRLSEGTADQARFQLAVPEATIEAMVPGYELSSLSLPLGLYPDDLGLIQAGEWEGQHYDHEAAVQVGASPSVSPFAVDFDPYHIRRVQATPEQLELWLGRLRAHPELRYISDGDPDIVTVPAPLPAELEGTLRPGLPVRRVPAAP